MSEDVSDLPEQEGVYNAARPQEVRRKAQEKKHRQKPVDKAWDALLATADGRAWLGWLLFEVAGLHVTTVNRSYDTNAILYREGMAEIGRAVEREGLRRNRDQYMLMMKEHMPQI